MKSCIFYMRNSLKKPQNYLNKLRIFFGNMPPKIGITNYKEKFDASNLTFQLRTWNSGDYLLDQGHRHAAVVIIL